MKIVHLFVSFAAIAAVSVAPALADPVARTTVKDPNRQICERIEETGSRLGGKRICMTAAEWQRQREEDRNLVDRIQQSHCNNGGGASC